MGKLTERRILRGTPEYAAVKALYNEAFGEIDDLDTMCRAMDGGKAALHGYYDGEELAAFALVLLPGRYCYVLYSALAKERRHKGGIREILALIRAAYPKRPLIFDIETPLEGSEDLAERRYRYEMFTHLGFADTGFGMTDASGTYTIFSEGGFDEASFRESWDILPEEFGGTAIVVQNRTAGV